MATAEYIKQGLMERGLPEHIAEGFVMNMQDESGLNPGVNETNPIIPGSRGGFGLYQLTGPRRTAYERFASEQGVDQSNADAQLDFLIRELNGPEANAAKSIFATNNSGDAASAILNDFLRPAEEHRARREEKYRGAPHNALASYGQNQTRDNTPGIYGPDYVPTMPVRDQTPGIYGPDYQENNALARNIGGERYSDREKLQGFLKTQKPNVLDHRMFMRQKNQNKLTPIPGVLRG